MVGGSALQAQLLGTFLEESFEGLERLEAGLLRLEEEGAEDDNVNDIFRAAHSLKGGAGTFGFTGITDVAHVMETVLDRVRGRSLAPTHAVTAPLLEAVDGLRAMLTALGEGRSPEAERVAALLGRLEGFGVGQAARPSGGAATQPTTAPPGQGWNIEFRPHANLLRTGNDPARLLRELERLGPMVVTADLGELPPLRELVVEDAYLAFAIRLDAPAPRAEIDEIFAWVEGDCDLRVTPIVPAPVAAAPGAAPAAPRSDTPEMASIRIGIDKVDLLMNMVGELVITQSMLGELEDDRPVGAERMGRIREGLAQLARNSRAIQESVMRLRSMPISVAFNRFPRLVHDLGRQLGKEVALEVVGQSTELDKTVLEKLGDPLVHLVRNSMDHGLETPEERRAAGKPTTGTLTLAAFHRGGDIVVEVADDGRGLDLVRILAKASERGLVAEKAALSDREIRELIFAPGFSTAAAVTDLSGRGVGMDVVRRNIRALGGEVSIDSTPGQGTKISLRLPLTLAIIDGQLVRVNGHPYVVPLLAIVESVQIEPRFVSRIVGEQDVYRLRDELVPMLPLAGVLGMASGAREPVQSGRLVVVEGEGRRLGLVVEEMLGLQQVVVKNLEANYQRVPGIAGATILGDGGVAFILDIAGLAELARKNKGTTKGTT